MSDSFDRFLRWYCADRLDERLRQAAAEWLVLTALGLSPEHQDLPEALAVSSALQAPWFHGPGQESSPVVFPVPESPPAWLLFALWGPPHPGDQPAQPLLHRDWLFWLVPRNQLHPERRRIGLNPLRRAQGDGVEYAALPPLLAQRLPL